MQPQNQTSDTAVIVGRWQIFHKGHETVLNTALGVAQRVIVVIGSAYRSRDTRNPFSWQERQAMIELLLPAAERARVQFLLVRDYFDDDRWNQAVRQGIEQLTHGQGKVTLVGFKKDASSYYLDHFPAWSWHTVQPEFDLDATSLRNVFFEGQDPDARLAVLAPYVSAPVLAYLQAWARLPAYAERVREQSAVAQYRKKWTANTYLTSDAVVVANQHVLLIRRGGDIGYGQWALPGGFVNPGERFYDASLRELAEETGFKPLASTMRHACQGRQLFDHPLRSARGRLITCAFHFDLGNVRLPEVQGADDALQAQWTPLAALLTLEDQLFEDHATILDHFIGLYR